MTKLQKARQLLLKQMKDIEQGKLNEIECTAVINVSDVLTKTYNTELRAKELEMRATELKTTVKGLDVFTDEDMQ
jgi:hypothetical protein